MRDPQIVLGRDSYYLTGVTRDPANPDPNTARWNDGARVWRSQNLVDWEPLGLVCCLDDGPPWMRNYPVFLNGGWQELTPAEFARTEVSPQTPVMRSWWGLKLRYSRSRDNYLLCGSLNTNMGCAPAEWHGDRFGGCFLFESTTGDVTGPYRVCSPLPLTHYIDPFLFEDGDQLYFLWQSGWIGRLTDHLDGLCEVNRLWMQEFNPEPTREGVTMFRHDGRYFLGFAAHAWWQEGRFTFGHGGHGSSAHKTAYCNLVCAGNSANGPFGQRHLSVVNGGHACHFQDREGEWWATTHNPPGDPLQINSGKGAMVNHLAPYLLPMHWEEGCIVPDLARAAAFNKRLRERHSQ